MASKQTPVRLWHPDSPGGRVEVLPGLLRRLGIVRSDFATLAEMRRTHKANLADYVAQLGDHVAPDAEPFVIQEEP